MTFNFTNRQEYQREIQTDFFQYSVSFEYANLFIQTETDLSELAQRALKKYYMQIRDFAQKFPEFEYSLVPVEIPYPVPKIVKDMLTASGAAETGPFSAVAGAVSEYVGRELLKYSGEVFVENGGDIFLCSKDYCTVAIYAGDSPLSMKAGIIMPPGSFGICTSAGRLGHSLSFGNAHAAVCVSQNTALADSCATLLGNSVKTPEDITGALNTVCGIGGIIGAVCIIDGHIGFSGDIEITKL